MIATRASFLALLGRLPKLKVTMIPVLGYRDRATCVRCGLVVSIVSGSGVEFVLSPMVTAAGISVFLHFSATPASTAGAKRATFMVRLSADLVPAVILVAAAGPGFLQISLLLLLLLVTMCARDTVVSVVG